jgi:hypothetical protein
MRHGVQVDQQKAGVANVKLKKPLELWRMTMNKKIKDALYLFIYIAFMLFMAAGAFWFMVEFFRVFGEVLK